MIRFSTPYRAPAVLLALCPLILPPTAQAQDDPLVITITGTRTERPVQEALAAVTVLTQDDIRRSQARSLPELLTAQPGVDLIRQGGRGKLTSLFIRGTEANHTLVLVDGVRIGALTDGAPALQHLPLTQIQRIEIVRGPRSALYGADALGGVIQIFTRRGGSEVYAGAGNNGTRSVGAHLSGGGDTWYSLGLDHYRTDGFNATTPESFVYEPDDDGYRNTSVNLRAGHRFGSGMELSGHLLRAEGDNEFDSLDFATGENTFPEDETLQQIASVKLNASLNEVWTTTLELAESRDEFETDDTAAPAFFDTRRRGLDLQNDLRLGEDQILTLGGEYYREHLDASVDFTEDSVATLGLYAQHQARFGRHDLALGLRHEDTDAFGAETTYNLAWGYELTDALRLTAAYSTGFSTPAFNDLYWPAGPFFVGNPDLEPETSRSLELGLSGRYGWGHWSLHAFDLRVDDLIVFVFDPDPFESTVENVHKARIRGLELEAGANLGDWHLGAALTLQDAEDRDTRLRLPRRAERSARLDLERRFGDGGIGLELIAQGDRYDDAGNTRRLPGYGVVNLTGNYALTPELSLRGRLDNLLDKDYRTSVGYRGAEREFLLSLHYRWR